MKNHFYHHTIWKHVAAFVDMFNDMEVYVYDAARKNVLGMKKVPVIIGPKEKVISVLTVVEGTPKPEVDNQFPKMSILWQGLTWDQGRQTGTKQKRNLGVEYRNDDGELSTKYTDLQTIPYFLEFQVTLWTSYLDESVQLLENILPFFHPDIHVSLYERITGQERKSQVKLQNVTANFVYELNEPDRRIIQFDLDFTMECQLYRPIEIDGVIEQAYIGIAAVDANSPTKNEGDVIYVTTSGISGNITDENIREVIISFDEADNDYTNFDIEQIINDIEVMKHEAIESLPDGTDEDIVAEVGNQYDDIIRQLGYAPESFPYNALQYRRNLFDTTDYARTAFMENTGLVDPSFPKFYEEGYDDMFKELDAAQQKHMFDVKGQYEVRLYAIEKGNEMNEYIQSLVDAGDPIFNQEKDLGEQSAEYNFLFD